MKRIVVIAFAVICLFAAIVISLPVSAAGGYLRGDADGDGNVNIKDVTTIQRHLADIDRLSGNRIKAADVDGNGLNIDDATRIQRYLAEFENIYHINETVTVPDPTTPQPTSDPFELPVVPKK